MTRIDESRSLWSTEDASFCTFPQTVKSIIASLRILIDQLDSDFKQARDLILEIAKRLDEGSLCERNQISRTIKKILIDKIQESKITEKWIEECLPPEYKRQYIKSERSSLSKHRPKRQLIEVSVEGNQILPEQQADKGIDRLSERQPSNKIKPADKLKHQRVIVHDSEAEALIQENDELKQDLLRQTAVQTADQVSKSELEFIVPKERHQEIEKAMHESKNLVYLIFDKSRTFLRSRSDVFH
jgi:hypothetical protein